MRLRITRQLCESIDGIQFSLFRPGYVYQVGTTIGNYLLAVGAAELAADDEPTSSSPRKISCSIPAHGQRRRRCRRATHLLITSSPLPQIGYLSQPEGDCGCD
jgi:hypothetical protein